MWFASNRCFAGAASARLHGVRPGRSTNRTRRALPQSGAAAVPGRADPGSALLRSDAGDG